MRSSTADAAAPRLCISTPLEATSAPNPVAGFLPCNPRSRLSTCRQLHSGHPTVVQGRYLAHSHAASGVLHWERLTGPGIACA